MSLRNMILGVGAASLLALGCASEATPVPEPASVTPDAAASEQPKSAPAAPGKIRQALPRKDL